jgi:hypothetical protein
MLLHVLYWLPTNDLFLLMRTNKLFEHGCRKIMDKRQTLIHGRTSFSSQYKEELYITIQQHTKRNIAPLLDKITYQMVDQMRESPAVRDLQMRGLFPEIDWNTSETVIHKRYMIKQAMISDLTDSVRQWKVRCSRMDHSSRSI